MSTLVFDGNTHTLQLRSGTGQLVGEWHANNVVDRRATLRFVPNRTFNIIDSAHPYRHGNGNDTINGAYGRFGILRLQDFTVDGVQHEGVGVHSGRADRGAADHPTMGCIRTTDEAMQAITQHIQGDPLLTITVQNNRQQPLVPNPRPGDAHPRRRHRQAAPQLILH
jgi:hypothetical protein